LRKNTAVIFLGLPVHFLKYQNRQIISYCFIVLMLVSCGKDSHDHPQLTTGKQFFDYHCASCHDTNGLGDFLKGIPSSILNNKNSSELIHYIRHDNVLKNAPKRDKMPVFKTMPDKEARLIARHLLKLKYNNIQKNKQLDKQSSLLKPSRVSTAGQNQQLDTFSNAFKPKP